MKYLRVLRVVGHTLLITGVVGFFYWASLWYAYYNVLPRSPQPAVGRIYPMNMHGFVKYATRKEQRHLDILEHASFAVAIIGGLLATLADPEYRKKMGWRYPQEPHTRARSS